MDELVRFRVHKDIAVVGLNRPPANLLNAAMRRALSQTLSAVSARADVRAIVLVGGQAGFSAGLDIRETAADAKDAPNLADICLQIEDSTKPVIAALDGNVFGGGAALALAAHYRLATPAARIAFPDVMLGLVPGAGSTQRLPRLVGAKLALELMLDGRPQVISQMSAAHLLDGVVDGGCASGGLAFARNILAVGKEWRPTRNRREGLADGAVYMAQVAARRAALAKSPLFAPERIADCVEAALVLPFSAGLNFEATGLADCIANPQSDALRHIYIAERRIGPDLLQRDAAGKWQPTAAAEAAILAPLRNALKAAADHLLSLGVAPGRVDDALVSFGFESGPFDGGAAGVEGRDVTLMQRRCIAALMAEGARLVEAGKVARAADIDALTVHGLKLARWRGGPMIAARQLGLLELRKDMRNWANESRLWAVPALVDEAVKYAAGFDAL